MIYLMSNKTADDSPLRPRPRLPTTSVAPPFMTMVLVTQRDRNIRFDSEEDKVCLYKYVTYLP